MQEMAFPGFKFQKFAEGVCPQTRLFMCGKSYLTERSLLKKMPPPPMGKSLKKALFSGHIVLVVKVETYKELSSLKYFSRSSRFYFIENKEAWSLDTEKLIDKFAEKKARISKFKV